MSAVKIFGVVVAVLVLIGAVFVAVIYGSLVKSRAANRTTQYDPDPDPQPTHSGFDNPMYGDSNSAATTTTAVAATEATATSGYMDVSPVVSTHASTLDSHA